MDRDWFDGDDDGDDDDVSDDFVSFVSSIFRWPARNMCVTSIATYQNQRQPLIDYKYVVSTLWYYS